MPSKPSMIWARAQFLLHRCTRKTRRRIASIFSPRMGAVASWVRTPRLPLVVNGAGDAIAALFFAHYLRTAEIAEALSRASSAIFRVLAKTVESGKQEIQLIAAQDEIVQPSRLFEARDLGQ